MSFFCETLNEILKERNLSTLEFSKLVGISATTLYDLKNFNPTILNALVIVDYFRSSLDYFERKTDLFDYNYNKCYEIRFADNLNKILSERNITKAKFCKELGLSKTNFTRWNRGVLPTYHNLLLICNYLDISIDELLGRI